MKQHFITCLLLVSSIVAQAQTIKYNLAELLKQNKLKVFNREIVLSTDKMANAVHLSSSENDGVAWLDGVDFSEGTIEVDIKGKDVLQHSFVGIAFHGIDLQTLDAVYLRPFNFQTSDPVRKIHAVQYVSHPDFPWHVLREKFNGTYEKEIIPAPNPEAWVHVKIVVEGTSIKVFVNNNAEPSLVVDKLNQRTSGKLGLWVGNTSDGDFANLTITKNAK